MCAKLYFITNGFRLASLSIGDRLTKLVPSGNKLSRRTHNDTPTFLFDMAKTRREEKTIPNELNSGINFGQKLTSGLNISYACQ